MEGRQPVVVNDASLRAGAGLQSEGALCRSEGASQRSVGALQDYAKALVEDYAKALVEDYAKALVEIKTFTCQLTLLLFTSVYSNHCLVYIQCISKNIQCIHVNVSFCFLYIYNVTGADNHLSR